MKINKILNVDEKGFITEKELQEMKDGCFLLLDPKTCTFENLPILSRKWNDTYYQLDTVEYKKNDRDKKYLDNLKKFVGVYKPVAVCDAWYLERRYAPIREKLNKLAKVVNYESDNQYMKNYQEYYEELSKLILDEDKFFGLFEEALVNLNYISVNCNYLLETQVRHAPQYVMTEEEKKKYSTNTEMFESLVFDGLAEHPEILDRYSEEELTERLNTEISIIEEGDVVDYFLMLRDIIRWGRDNNILVGLGRGSAASSLISYLLGIVKVEPLEYELLFSRFLTKGRLIRHEEEEVVTINGEREISGNTFIKIVRNGEEMIIRAKELKEGDELINE